MNTVIAFFSNNRSVINLASKTVINSILKIGAIITPVLGVFNTGLWLDLKVWNDSHIWKDL